MGVKETFDVDLHELTEKYRDLQRILHPDKYSQKSETEKEFSLQHSAIVNRAYNTLQRPLARGLYLLHLNEDALEHETQIAASDFLDEILETNEAILEAESADEIATIGARNQAKIDAIVLRVSEAFKNNDQQKAKELLIRLKYYSNIGEKIKEALQKCVS
jgi:molecular chaperone HscB